MTNPVQVKKLYDSDCYQVLVDGEPLSNAKNNGWFTKHDLQNIADACSIALIDDELTDVKLDHIGEHGADDWMTEKEGDR